MAYDERSSGYRVGHLHESRGLGLLARGAAQPYVAREDRGEVERAARTDSKRGRDRTSAGPVERSQPARDRNRLGQGARICELLGLKWKYINLKSGVIQILQRNWRGDIDDPKSAALLPARQYHLAAGSWRFKYRGIEDRRAQYGSYDRGIHEDSTHLQGRTHASRPRKPSYRHLEQLAAPGMAGRP